MRYVLAYRQPLWIGRSIPPHKQRFRRGTAFISRHRVKESATKHWNVQLSHMEVAILFDEVFILQPAEVVGSFQPFTFL
jgi:hypothetical protein